MYTARHYARAARHERGLRARPTRAYAAPLVDRVDAELEPRESMIRLKWAVFVVLGAAALAGTGALAMRSSVADDSPTQPIAFPHDLHAGKNHIPCMYCHYSADRSVDAGIPAVQTCAGCHIPGGVPLLRADRPGVKQLATYWNKKQPIPWVRIHKLPDHVHFPHMRHIKAGLAC